MEILLVQPGAPSKDMLERAFGTRFSMTVVPTLQSMARALRSSTFFDYIIAAANVLDISTEDFIRELSQAEQLNAKAAIVITSATISAQPIRIGQTSLVIIAPGEELESRLADCARELMTERQ